MSDTLRISGAAQESILEFGRDHSEKLQQLSRSVLSTLYMLVRSAKMYDPDNAVFDKPLMSLQDSLNLIISREGRFDLVGIKASFYVNNMLVKVELNAVENIRYLLEEMRAKDVGGFTLSKPVQIAELKNFVWIFSKEVSATAGEDGLPDRKLLAIKIARWSKLKERLDKENLEDDQKVDRKKYAMTVYARGVFFISKYLDSVRAGKPMTAARALRIVQDFVDICYDQKVHFLGMTTVRRESDYLVFHQVNTCLLSIVFGAELGLTKAQLRDLGFIALFHDAGMATLPDQLADKRGGLTAEERALVARAPLVSVRNILMEKGFTRTTLHRVVTTLEYKSDFGTAVRDARGNIQMIIPKSSLGLYAKIIAIASGFDALTSKRPFREAYGPEVAMMLMWSELRHKFDPELLQVFMRVLAIPPVKVLSRRQQGSLSLGGL
jgi:HD-GYP domain-containing protein (c-di-GMP phosphodiesterase class II)